MRYSSTNYHPLFDDESSPRAHTLICARTLTCCCTSLPAELDPPLCFYSELIHSVLIMAAAEAKTLKDNMCAAMTCQFCHIVIEMFAFFFSAPVLNSLAGSQSSGLHVALDGLPPPGLHSFCHHALHAVTAIRTPPIIPMPSCCPLLTP